MYVSSDPLEPSVKQVQMSLGLRGRLHTLLHTVAANTPPDNTRPAPRHLQHAAVSNMPKEISGGCDMGGAACLQGAHISEGCDIKMTGVRLMEVDVGSPGGTSLPRLEPVIVPICSLQPVERKEGLCNQRDRRARAHAAECSWRTGAPRTGPRPLPLPPGGSLKNVGDLQPSDLGDRVVVGGSRTRALVAATTTPPTPPSPRFDAPTLAPDGVKCGGDKQPVAAHCRNRPSKASSFGDGSSMGDLNFRVAHRKALPETPNRQQSGMCARQCTHHPSAYQQQQQQEIQDLATSCTHEPYAYQHQHQQHNGSMPHATSPPRQTAANIVANKVEPGDRMLQTPDGAGCRGGRMPETPGRMPETPGSMLLREMRDLYDHPLGHPSPDTILRAEMLRHAAERRMMASVGEAEGYVADGMDGESRLMSQVMLLRRSNPLLARLEEHQVAALIDGAQVLLLPSAHTLLLHDHAPSPDTIHLHQPKR